MLIFYWQSPSSQKKTFGAFFIEKNTGELWKNIKCKDCGVIAIAFSLRKSINRFGGWLIDAGQAVGKIRSVTFSFILDYFVEQRCVISSPRHPVRSYKQHRHAGKNLSVRNGSGMCYFQYFK